MSSTAIAAVTQMMETLPEPMQNQVVEYLRQHIAALRWSQTRRKQYTPSTTAAGYSAETAATIHKIEQEQEWWLNQPSDRRIRYKGEFVAVHNRRLVDHDRDVSALYKRIRLRYGEVPVLIMPAEGPREIHIKSPRLVLS